MAVYSYFFNAQKTGSEYDRVYTASDFTDYLDGIVGSGVFPSPSDCMQVYAGTGMNVLVKPGQGWIEGHKIINTADLQLAVDPADVTLNRIDRVVFRVNKTDRVMEIIVKKGANASSPSAPDIVRTQDIIEYSLAEITVNRNTTAITDAMIRDTRLDSSVCGVVQGLIQQVDTATLYKQWTAAYDAQYAAYTAAYEKWFESIKDALPAKMWKEYKNLVKTGAGETEEVDIGISQYNKETDILTVYVNGFRLNEEEYTNTGTKIQFTKPLDVEGTAVEIVVYRSDNGE